jgi:hypothetical protein
MGLCVRVLAVKTYGTAGLARFRTGRTNERTRIWDLPLVVELSEPGTKMPEAVDVLDRAARMS